MNNEQLPAARLLARALRAESQGASPKWTGHAADMLEAQYDYIESLSAIKAAGGVEAFRAMVTEAAIAPYRQEIVKLKAAAQPAARAPVLAWAVAHNADMALTQSAVIAQAWSKAGLEVIPLAPASAPAAQDHAAAAQPVAPLGYISPGRAEALRAGASITTTITARKAFLSDVAIYASAPAQGLQKEVFRRAEQLIDVMDDHDTNAPEHRCYVSGAYETALNKLRGAVAAARAAQGGAA